jgi:predicted SAM-dependent methyltransferase
MDISREWLFPDNAFDGVFCEHVLEHFDHSQGAHLMQQAWRVLRPGGCLRIVVPDGERIMRMYFETPRAFPEWRLVDTGCAMEAVNGYFRQGYEHQLMYDWCLLADQLFRVGFVQIEKVSFGQGKLSRPVLLDDQKYQTESLYVEALKPGS